jgi:hypothetical protein
LPGLGFILYFLFAPPADLLRLEGGPWIARSEGRLLRWQSSGRAAVFAGGQLLARFPQAANVVADYREEGFLRLTLRPDAADNSVVYAQSAREIFVNGRKIGCREEGTMRRLYYPVLQNREPCEK